MPFPHVFEPLTIRHRTLTSRISFGAHTANMAEGGLPGERHLAYYRERALGGAGMIVVEPLPVHRTAILTRGNFRNDDGIVPHFRRVVDACREANPDIVMIQQLYHVGQHGDADNSFLPNWSPSGLPSYHDADGSHAMDASEIESVVEGFIGTAQRAQAAGFDGVELFGAYHGLIEQFWTPWSNRRTDAWGGSFEARMRFSSTILEGIRQACGENFIVGLAVSLDEASEPTLTIDGLGDVVAWHDERGLVDYVSGGTGSYFDFFPIIPVSLFEANLGVPVAAALKRRVRRAVVQAESHIGTPENAERVLAAGDADMVSIVRGQIADPHLVAKARADRADEVRPCISCNQLCWGRRSRDYWISCLVNPSAGREFEWGGDRPIPADTTRTVLIVGGGPAGLEAARVAAERGHRVTLLERESQLGGQFLLAGRQPSRDRIGRLLRWYADRLDALGVDVRLGVDATVDDVAAAGVEVVIVATGSRPPLTGFQRALPMVDRLPGTVRDDAVSVQAVLAGTADVRGRVLILDDVHDWRGLGTALFLLEAGHDVVIATAAPVVGGGLQHSAADGPLRAHVASLAGVLRPSTIILDWDGSAATVRSTLTGTTDRIAADTLVIAETAVAETTILDGLRSRGIAFEAIGDCVAPRRASLAFYEGRELAQRL
jgi:2,4-dienoyl-CoA reductase-like NADH-dependent reductase (Old Yellow Enzyme family)